jgi:hypothetical protein
MNDLTRLSASQVRPLLQQGTVTVEEYAKALLSRIDQRDSVVHAWAFLDREFVLAQARKLDLIPPEKRGPLHGIPIAIKDVAHTNGRHKKIFCVLSTTFRLRVVLIHADLKTCPPATTLISTAAPRRPRRMRRP